MSKKILFVIASDGYQPHEYAAAKQAVKAGGVEVVTASDKLGTAVAKDDSTAQVDIALDNIKLEDYDGIFFIGGPGAMQHLDNEASYRILREAKEKGIAHGAICISPRILAKAGVLQNKKATGWDGDNELSDVFAKSGTEYIREEVVVDKNLVTANGPAAAEKFGRAILNLL